MTVVSRWYSVLSVGAALLLIAGCTGRPPDVTERPAAAGEGAAVPVAQAKLYAEIKGTLDRCRLILGQGPQAAAGVVCSTELITANGNRGEELLRPNSLAGTILFLERCRGLGIGGVKITITYPLLSPGYPRSREYLEFFKRAAAEARKRGMKILIGIGLIFNEPEISAVKPDYSGLTAASFIQSLREYARLISDGIGPDYLTVLNEPLTLKHIAPGLAALADPAEYGRALGTILEGLERRGVLVGAGAGAWEDAAFFRQAVSSGIDYLDIHSYPLQRGCFERVLEAAGLARAGGKRVVIGEAWLYKVTADELIRQGAVSTMAFGRDAFSFWAPLDSEFLDVMTTLARRRGVEFVSFYWGAKYFFAYLDYEAFRNSSPAGLIAQSSAEAAKNIMAGRLSATGRALQTLLR